jgi:hypothetical protein
VVKDGLRPATHKIGLLQFVLHLAELVGNPWHLLALPFKIRGDIFSHLKTTAKAWATTEAAMAGRTHLFRLGDQLRSALKGRQAFVLNSLRFLLELIAGHSVDIAFAW